MHLEHEHIPTGYRRYVRRKVIFLFVSFILLLVAFVVSLMLGAADLSVGDVLGALTGRGAGCRAETIVRNIRLPQALGALLAGMGLAASGTVMQSVLRNPLGSPFTLGIAHAAAFGAALSTMLFRGIHTYATPGCALLFSGIAAGLIVALMRFRGAAPETMVLSGVALGTLFTSATMVLQFFADDTQLASMVFWTFGDTARAHGTELAVMAVTVILGCLFFGANGWSYNALDSGDETAKGLGVRTEAVRIGGMAVASLVTAVLIAFVGIIGFVGLVVPHIARRIVGADHRFLLPASILLGGLLLLVSDTVARLLLAPHVLPVSVLTSFLGAPLFFWLVLGRRR